MAFKRYIHKDGKKVGPYYYENIRSPEGKVKTIYLGSKYKPQTNKLFSLFLIILFLVVLLGVSLFFSRQDLALPAKASEKSFEIDQQLIKVLLKEGESVTKPIRIMNTGQDAITFKLSSLGLGDLVQLNTPEFSLKPGQTQMVDITFKSSFPERKVIYNPDVYVGKIIAQAGGQTMEVPLIVEIESKTVLFDMNLNIAATQRQVMQGQATTAEVTLFNLQQISPASVRMEYHIKDLSSNTILTESETVVIETRASFSKTFKIPTNLATGTYVFLSKAMYGNSVGTATYTFDVISPKGEEAKQFEVSAICSTQDPLCWISLLVLVLLIFFIGAYAYFFIGAYVFEKVSRDILRKPTPKELQIGKGIPVKKWPYYLIMTVVAILILTVLHRRGLLRLGIQKLGTVWHTLPPTASDLIIIVLAALALSLVAHYFLKNSVAISNAVTKTKAKLSEMRNRRETAKRQRQIERQKTEERSKLVAEQRRRAVRKIFSAINPAPAIKNALNSAKDKISAIKLPKLRLPKFKKKPEQPKFEPVQRAPVFVPAEKPRKPLFKLPKLHLPKIKLPEVHLPKLRLPKVKLPEVHLPKFKLPRFKLPKFRLPRLRLPRLKQKQVAIRKLPEQPKAKAHKPLLKLPKLKFPKLHLPKIKLPKIRLPKIRLPKFSLSSTPIVKKLSEWQKARKQRKIESERKARQQEEIKRQKAMREKRLAAIMKEKEQAKKKLTSQRRKEKMRRLLSKLKPSSIKEQIANISLPKIKLPRIRLPKFKLPRFKPRSEKMKPEAPVFKARLTLSMQQPKRPLFRLPKLNLPRIKLPKLHLPKFRLPKIRMPKFRLPKLKLPEIKLPKIHMPKIKLPKFRLPKFKLPKFKKKQPKFEPAQRAPVFVPAEKPRKPLFKLPKFRMPEVHLPKIRLPKIHLPKIRLPKIKLPKFKQPFKKLFKPKKVPEEVEKEVIKQIKIKEQASPAAKPSQKPKVLKQVKQSLSNIGYAFADSAKEAGRKIKNILTIKKPKFSFKIKKPEPAMPIRKATPKEKPKATFKKGISAISEKPKQLIKTLSEKISAFRHAIREAGEKRKQQKPHHEPAPKQEAHIKMQMQAPETKKEPLTKTMFTVLHNLGIIKTKEEREMIRKLKMQKILEKESNKRTAKLIKHMLKEIKDMVKQRQFQQAEQAYKDVVKSFKTLPLDMQMKLKPKIIHEYHEILSLRDKIAK